MSNFSLKVVEIRHITDDTITLCLKKPALRKFHYLSGQYVSLIFRINGRRYVRPYSFSSCSLIDPLIEVTIKRVPGGIVSTYIHDKIQVGDIIEALEPMGNFIYQKREGISDVFFWAGGTGITPLFSIIKQILIVDKSIKLHLVYITKNASNTIFYSQLKELVTLHSEQLSICYFHSQPDGNSESIARSGRLTQKDVLELMKSFNMLTTCHFICGPKGMQENVYAALRSVNTDVNNILVEKFILERSSKELQDIQTQSVRLLFEGRENLILVPAGESILESALNAGVELPYSCQTGNCNTCKAVCLEGKVRILGNMQREDLNEKELLLCCSFPESNNVVVSL